MELLHLAVRAHGRASGVHDVEYRICVGAPVAVFLLAEGRRGYFADRTCGIAVGGGGSGTGRVSE